MNRCKFAENDFILLEEYDLCIARVCAMLVRTQQHKATARRVFSRKTRRFRCFSQLTDAKRTMAGSVCAGMALA
jgi:hypothetical protein